MSELRTRRSILRASGVLATGSLAGCLVNNPEVPGNHLYVENTSSRAVVVTLTVAAGTDTDGNAVVEGRYRIPPGFAMQFEGILEANQTNTIGVRRPTSEIDDGDSVAVTVRPCQGNPESGRDVSGRLRPDRMGAIPWGCGEEYARRELEYVEPEQLRVESAGGSETVTTVEAHSSPRHERRKER